MRKKVESSAGPWETERIVLPVMTLGEYVLFLFVFSFIQLS